MFLWDKNLQKRKENELSATETLIILFMSLIQLDPAWMDVHCIWIPSVYQKKEKKERIGISFQNEWMIHGLQNEWKNTHRIM